jgi:catechol 2,3-dioxygenase-like lactoylglutathione lyase family enzyme
MQQKIGYVALLVRDYDEAIAYFTDVLRFTLIEDTRLADAKRWVLVAPPGSNGTCVVLAKAVTSDQVARVGNQAPAGECSCSCTPTTSGATITACEHVGSCFGKHPGKKPMAPSPCSKISTATDGICCNSRAEAARRPHRQGLGLRRA